MLLKNRCPGTIITQIDVEASLPWNDSLVGQYCLGATLNTYPILSSIVGFVHSPSGRETVPTACDKRVLNG